MQVCRTNRYIAKYSITIRKAENKKGGYHNGYHKINWTWTIKNKIPELKIGDTVKVHQRIKEGNRERIQVFEGIIIKKQGGGVNATFTVRRVAYGVGVEKLS